MITLTTSQIHSGHYTICLLVRLIYLRILKKEFQALLQDPHISELLQDFEDRYYHGDPMDTDNIYNNIQPAAYEDYDLSYLHK